MPPCDEDRSRNQEMLRQSMGDARFFDASETVPVRTLLQDLEDRVWARASHSLTCIERRAHYLLETGKFSQFKKEFPNGLPPL